MNMEESGLGDRLQEESLVPDALSEAGLPDEDSSGSPEKKGGADISRRGFAMGALGVAGMFCLGGLKLVGVDPICRPPGAQDEWAFLSACIHCEKCREVCPKGAIKPARIESGALALRTPQMDFKHGWCDFCESTPDGKPLCAEVCPTNAFKLPAGKLSENVVIGKANIKAEWCLATTDMGCRDCVDACPYNAMGVSTSGIPYVIEDRCNGCGACEFACISMKSGSIASGATDRAIIVVPKGGSR